MPTVSIKKMKKKRIMMIFYTLQNEFNRRLSKLSVTRPPYCISPIIYCIAVQEMVYLK